MMYKSQSQSQSQNPRKSLSLEQENSVNSFYNFLDKLPKAHSAPQWFIKLLSSILPHKCIFEKAIFNKNGKLVLYIPQLCKLNPFFDLIMEYRLKSYFE